MPDFKTIADFRRDNGPAIRAACAQFIMLCRKLNLFTRAVVALDGSKFKAVNNRDKNFTTAKVAKRIEQVEAGIARYLERAKHDQAEQQTAEELLDQVKEALQDVAQTTSGTMDDAYRAGQSYMRDIRDRYPEAERFYQQGRRAISQRTTENPLMSLLLAAAAGYALAWMIHGQRRKRDDHVPEYGRTSRGYAPQRDEQRR